jgi:hypothetical protein
MSSNKPFIPNSKILKDFANGDIKITEAFITPVLSGIGGKSNNNSDNNLFEEQSKNSIKGFKALEKTIVSTFFDTQKPIIEGVLLILDLFASLELTKTYITGGINPFKDPNSFVNEKASNIKSINEISKQDTDIIEYPNKIILTKYDSNNNKVNIDINTDSYYGDWNKYISYQELVQLRRNQHEIDFNTFTLTERNEMFKDRLDMIKLEYENTIKDSQIKNLDFLSNDIKFIFDNQNIIFLNKEILIDIESDYYVDILKEEFENNYKHYTYIATRKPINELENAESLKNGANFITSNPAKAIKIFLKQVIPIISKKIIKLIKMLQKIISDPGSFLLLPLIEKLKDKFEFLDKDLKNKPKTDKTKTLYYDDKNNFILDGTAKIKLFSKELGLTIKDGVITKLDNLDNKIQPLLELVLNIMKIPFELIKDFINTLKDLIKSLMKLTEIPNKYNEFLTFEWLKKLISPENLLKYIGSTDGTLMTLPFLKIPNVGDNKTINKVIQTIKDFITSIFTSFITLIENIFNIKLNIKLSL